MVTIRDNLTPPLKWRLEWVHEVLLGKDGAVRVVRVLISRGVVTRTVAKLVSLPVSEENQFYQFCNLAYVHYYFVSIVLSIYYELIISFFCNYNIICVLFHMNFFLFY